MELRQREGWLLTQFQTHCQVIAFHQKIIKSGLLFSTINDQARLRRASRVSGEGGVWGVKKQYDRRELIS